jgi:hypothetical protein
LSVPIVAFLPFQIQPYQVNEYQRSAIRRPASIFPAGILTVTRNITVVTAGTLIDGFIQLDLLLQRQLPASRITPAEAHPAPAVTAPLTGAAVRTGEFLFLFIHRQNLPAFQAGSG